MSDASNPPTPSEPAVPAVPEVPGTPLPAENVTRGTLFALLALPAGVLVWGVVASFDFISGWIAIGIAIFALWLYRKGSGGRIGFNGAARVAIISLVTLIIAYVVGIAVGYPVEFSRALSRGTVIPLIGQYISSNPLVTLGFPVIFGVLGVVAIFRTAASQRALPPPA